MKTSWTTLFAVVFVLISAPRAEASATTADFVVASLRNQWSSEIVHVIPPAGHTVSNPGSCSSSDAYAEDGAVTGHKERTTMLVGAFLNGKTTRLVVDGCSSDNRPKIVSVQVFP